MWSRARLRLLSAASAAPDTGILVASADRKGGCCKPTAAEMTACGHDLVRSIADEQTWSRRADLEQTSRLGADEQTCFVTLGLLADRLLTDRLLTDRLLTDRSSCIYHGSARL